jgi:hypothetical protein
MHLTEDQKAEISSAIHSLIQHMYQNQRTEPYDVEILGEGQITLQSIGGIGKSEGEREAYRQQILPEIERESKEWIARVSPTPGTDAGGAANRLRDQHTEEILNRKLEEFDTPPDELIHELPAIDFELPDAQRLTWIEVILTSADGCSESETILL